ncbi:MAG: serine hydrolase [Caldilineaceae bacterium]|nr:serine hydrolase [Caldilineaceae bacterium]
MKNSDYVDGTSTSDATKNWPTDDWPTSTPENLGMDSESLVELLSFYRENKINIHSLLIIRNGNIGLDACFYPFTPGGTVHDVASVTKSITSVLIGIAIVQGFIESVDQPLLSYFPERTIANLDANKEKISIENLLTMTSGFHCGYQPGEKEHNEMFKSEDWVQFVLDLPMARGPGQKYAYCSGNSHLLSAVLTKATGMSMLDFARKYLFTPLGINEVFWPADPQGITRGWGDLHLHPRDLAKIGYLYLNKGLWEGKQLLNAAWVEKSTQAQADRAAKTNTFVRPGRDYGYAWHLVSEGPFSGMYYAAGRGGQLLNVIPDANIVTVITGGENALLEFDGERIGEFILSISDQALPENLEGNEILQQKTEAITAPSPPEQIYLPEIAQVISGETFTLEENFLNFKTISLRFNGKEEAEVRVSMIDPTSGKYTQLVAPIIIQLAAPMRLDGIYTFVPGRFGLSTGIKGHWDTNDDLLLTIDEIADINVFELRMSFEADKVTIVLNEKTRLIVNETFEGVRQN